MNKIQLDIFLTSLLESTTAANENTKKFRHEDSIYTAHLSAVIILNAVVKALLAVRDAE